ncbi:MAG: cell division protein ZapA [Rhizobiaceae bacterium]|nr:cell division protein ZapA [Rhizobiaceae bacterium]
MPSVMVTINGKSYRMACDEGQEKHLEKLAETLNGYVENLKGSFGEIGDQRLSVMAGIMVTDELNEMTAKVKRLEKEINSLQAKRDTVAGEMDSADSDVAAGILEASKRLEALAEKLTAPLGEPAE